MKQNYIKAYFATEGAMRRKSMADALGISRSRLTQLSQGHHIPPEIALKIEGLTNGELDAGKLSPIVKQAREKWDD